MKEKINKIKSWKREKRQCRKEKGEEKKQKIKEKKINCYFFVGNFSKLITEVFLAAHQTNDIFIKLERLL